LEKRLGLKELSKKTGAGQRCDWVAPWKKKVTTLRRDEKKVDQLWGIGPKELREYRKWFLISRI
jgi:hypothetical protein